MVTVRALTGFDYKGRTVTKGEVIDLDRPLDAILLYRKGHVSLSKVYRAAALQPEPPNVPPPAPRRRRPRTDDAGSPRPKRAYRRRDLTAETP
jgi:hypothetical protein